MITNPGFLVRSDRFSMNDDTVYLLNGWLRPDSTLHAFVDGKPFPMDVEVMTGNSDERYGGCETSAVLRFGSEIESLNSLKIYAESDLGRKLSFEISGRELREKRGAIRYFIDDYTVNPKENLFRLTGWAVAKEPVEIRVYEASGNRLDGVCERYKRLDTVELFDEYPVEEYNGFNIEIRPVPKGGVRVRLHAGLFETILSYPTSMTGFMAKRAGQLLGKAADALKYNGPEALWVKTYNKLFNPAMRRVNYSDWIKKHLPSDRVLALQSKEDFAMSPLISIVVPCFRTPEKYLRELVNSVKGQSYGKWELILSDGSGPDSPIRGLLKELEESDERIRVISHKEQKGISENTNAAIAAAGGSWIAFADHDDILVKSALYEAVKLINERGDTEVIYTDEDKIGTGDQLLQPNMKPDWDPDFLNSVNYICHLLLVKKSTLDGVRFTDGDGRTCWLDPAYDGAQDHDLLLRLSERTERIAHIPKVLYHWRFFEGSTAADPESKTWAFEAGKRAVQAHYDRLGWPAEVCEGEYPGLYRTIWKWEEKPMVSVIIPNKDHIDDLKKCLHSMAEHVKWPSFEILVIENNSTEESTFTAYSEMEEDPLIRVIHYEGPFNYSAINNFGAREAKGEYLLLLNNDTEFITDAMTLMMGYAMRPDVGAVGARLYYGDDTIQHAGAIIGWGGVAGHAFVNQKRGETGYQHRIICQQDMSAVTAACMMVRKEVFDRVGGFTEELAVAFNDIDLCMKIRKEGYLIVYEPYAELYHYESKSRGLENTPEKKSRFGKELTFFRKRWPEILRDGDPYYSPNLSMITQDFSLKHI